MFDHYIYIILSTTISTVISLSKLQLFQAPIQIYSNLQISQHLETAYLHHTPLSNLLLVTRPSKTCHMTSHVDVPFSLRIPGAEGVDTINLDIISQAMLR